MERYVRDPHRPEIGTGAYGVVYRVKCRETNEEFALKCYTRHVEASDIHGSNVEDSTVRELSCLAALRGHPNIIEMLDCFVDDTKSMAMLMPYVSYTLRRAIYTTKQCNGKRAQTSALVRNVMPLSFVASFSAQTANALAYMHKLNWIHRDVTPSNILLTEDLTVKVADMGLARQSSKRMSLTVVTEPYRAPELFDDGMTSEYTSAIDMWSLGAVIADAMEGKMVFSRSKTYSTMEVIAGLVQKRSDCPEANEIMAGNRERLMGNVMGCELVKRIVFGLLVFDPTKRLTAEELLCDSEWMGLARIITLEEKAMVIKLCEDFSD